MTQIDLNTVIKAGEKANSIQNLIDFITRRYRNDRQLKNKILDKLAKKHSEFNGFSLFDKGEMTGNFKQLLTAYRLSAQGKNSTVFARAMRIQLD